MRLRLRALALVLLLGADVHADPDDAVLAQPRIEAPAAIGRCDVAATGGAVRFGIAHLNDLQARYSDVIDGQSRYAYIAGYLRQLKAAQPTLVVDAGDDYEKGALAELRSLGETTRQIVQAMPFDVRTIGNHDFAYGETAVLRDARLSKHPLLAANVKQIGAATQPFRPYVQLTVGCAKVGVIGLVTQAFGADDRPTSAAYDGVFAQDDHYQAIVEREAKAHRAEVDVLIALTHLGYADDLALAHRGGKLVDFFIGGHTEDLLREPGVVVHPDKTKTFVMQAGHYGERIGRFDVVVHPGKRERVAIEKYGIVDVDASLPRDNDVAELVRKLESAVVPDAHTPIGRLAAPVKQGKDLAALVWRAAADTQKADALVIGKDLFWSGLPKGDLTLQRLYDSVLVQRQPAGTSGFSSLWIGELDGAELKALAKGFQQGGTYEWFGVKSGDPKKRYRVAFDKRALLFPQKLFGSQSKVVRGTFAGELIDVLEAYVRARTARGLTVD